MPSVIQLKSGKCTTVLDFEDLLRLVEEHMGEETRRMIEENMLGPEEAEQYIDNLEKENQKIRDHHHEVMQALRKQSETIARLIQEKEIDRVTLSSTAGVIGKITWREINVR